MNEDENKLDLDEGNGELQGERLDQLQVEPTRAKVSQGYTRFVRSMRVILPLIALCLIAVVIAWPDMENTIEPLSKKEILAQTPPVGQNELISPRFESTDDQRQPYTITANKAFQNQNTPELVRLEKPMADIVMKDGAWVAAEAKEGTYEQHAEKLFLKGDVRLFHDSGYQLETQELRVNIKTQQAWSDQPVYGQGPAGTLKASGLEANVGNDTLIFLGPAILTLNKEASDLEIGGKTP